MGLDVVELVMRVEEEFNIEIFDEEATQLETVGQLHRCILGKLEMLDAGRCQSSATFYQLRRSLADLTALPRRAISPTTSVSEILPLAQRRQKWKIWSEAARVELPALEKPKWMRAAIPLFFATIAGAAFYGWNTSSYTAFWPYALALVAIYRFHQWSEIHAVNLPADCATMAGLTKTVMRLNYGINTEPRDPQSAQQIWEKLREIMVDELEIEPEQITPDAHFVRDLGLG